MNESIFGAKQRLRPSHCYRFKVLAIPIGNSSTKMFAEKHLAWMIQNQRTNGDLYVRTDPKSDGNAWLYSHAIATLALCEAYGMTQDESIKGNAQRRDRFLGSESGSTRWWMAVSTQDRFRYECDRLVHDGPQKRRTFWA